MSTVVNIVSMFFIFVSCAIIYEFFAYVKRIVKLMMYDALYIILTFEYPEYDKCTIEYIVFINPDGKKYVGKL